MENGTCAFVILGATGDLTRRKLMPALSRLFELHAFTKFCAIVGSGRHAMSDEKFRGLFEAPGEFGTLLSYHQGIAGLKEYLQRKGTFSRVIVFLALPPEVYTSTARELYEEGFRGETSLIIEKPFGSDLASAGSLNAELSRYFPESQIYRNDHYLAKEAVQNILVFRFANMLFQPEWNAQHIESIQINASETQGIGSRGPYFDKAGIIRDMAQNHLMQLLALMTMEAPVSLSPGDINAKKIDVLRSLTIEQSVRYQYEGYRREKGVDPESATETYAELKLAINNFRWAGMPIYMRCGKALDRTGTEMSVRFKAPPRVLFNERGGIPHNMIVFKIQPAEGIIVNMSSKEPGNEIRMSTTNMTFCYRDSFNGEMPDAYQRILLDVIRGDHTLFVTAAETQQLWKIIDPVVGKGNLSYYKPGELPPTALDIPWTDFGKFSHICA